MWFLRAEVSAHLGLYLYVEWGMAESTRWIKVLSKPKDQDPSPLVLHFALRAALRRRGGTRLGIEEDQGSPVEAEAIQVT